MTLSFEKHLIRSLGKYRFRCSYFQIKTSTVGLLISKNRNERPSSSKSVWLSFLSISACMHDTKSPFQRSIFLLPNEFTSGNLSERGIWNFGSFKFNLLRQQKYMRSHYHDCVPKFGEEKVVSSKRLLLICCKRGWIPFITIQSSLFFHEIDVKGESISKIFFFVCLALQRLETWM